MNLWKSDYFTLAKFVFPLAFTDLVVDIGEQFLNRSIAHSVNVVENLAAFGLAYIFTKFCVGILEEVKQVGLVLVQDRPGFHKILICILVMATSFFILQVIISETKLGLWLIKDLHGVSSHVYVLTRQALLFLSAYPAIHAVSWYHGGVLLQYRHSVLVGLASLMDIITQVIVVGVLLWTPLACHTPIAVPIIAAYAGILIRCTLTLTIFYWKVYPKLKKEITKPVTMWKLSAFLSPLMFVLAIQRSTRPILNLLVAHFSSTKAMAAISVSVLTIVYPLGRFVYGWLNQLRPVSPTFEKDNQDQTRKSIGWRKIAIFHIASLCLSAFVSFSLFWIPGVSLLILEHVISIPHQLALLCINPLRVFAFFCFTVSVRSALTGWLTLHQQTRLLTPSGFLRLVVFLATFFTLYRWGLSGALLGVLALFSAFFSEMVGIIIIVLIYICWRKCNCLCLATRFGKRKDPVVLEEIYTEENEVLVDDSIKDAEIEAVM